MRALRALGPVSAILVFRLNMTYRYDNIREGVVGWNPARKKGINLFRRLEGLLRFGWDKLTHGRTIEAQKHSS